MVSLRSLGATSDSTMVYDITAYLEGSSCIVAEYGYSPGGKAGHKQIKIALAITRDGFPFYRRVLRGGIGRYDGLFGFGFDAGLYARFDANYLN